MIQKFIYSLFIVVMAAHSTYGSTYLTEEAAEEGVRRGASETFPSSVGVINADGLDSHKDYIWLKFNGVLIHPSLVLTSRHCLKKYSITDGSFWANADAGQAWEEVTNKETSSGRRQELQKYCSQLDLNTIYFPPDEGVDLAIIRLKRPLSQVKLLPLLLDRPKKDWSNGYFVSYAPVYTLSGLDKILNEHKRHIAILDVKEKEVVDIKEKVDSSSSQSVLVSRWHLEGNPHDPLNRKFIPQNDMHRLTAFTQESDSGAAFIVTGQKKGDYFVAGIHRGRGVDEEHGEVLSLIIPLYPHKKWIEGALTLTKNG